MAGPKEQFLIVNQGQSILKVPLTSSGATAGGDHRLLYVPRELRKIQSSKEVKYRNRVLGMRAVGISTDCRQQFVYFTDTSSKTIQRMKYDGSEQKIIVEGRRPYRN